MNAEPKREKGTSVKSKPIQYTTVLLAIVKPVLNQKC